MIAHFEPSKLNGATIEIPASKSLSHRALITAALADGTSRIKNVVKNNDTDATIACMEKLGAKFEKEGEDWIVHGTNDFSKYDGSVVDCGESGSTLRFLIPIFSLTGKKVTFTGHGRLMQRPQDVYKNLFLSQGLLFETTKDTLTIEGCLKPGDITVRGDISSQFISGLLFTLPLLNGDSTLHILPPYESKSYTGLTLSSLKKAGIEVEEKEWTYVIKGNQSYHSFEGLVEGDDSQGVFFAGLSLVSGIEIKEQGLSHESRQGDHAFLKDLESMGLQIQETEKGYRFSKGTPVASTIDLADTPDLGPALFAVATQCDGITTFTHCERLHIKESDRIACMEEELRKLGCTISSDGGTVTVQGKTIIQGGVTLHGHNDHRIVMALSILASIAKEPVEITEAESISKSYPNFFMDLKKTGVNVDVR